MNGRQAFLASIAAFSLAVLVYAFLFRASAFERVFDKNLARFPLAASMASRDPELRRIFLRQTEDAFKKGGWRAANGALRVALAAEVEVYADDEHVNAVSRANLAVLLKLESKPAACRAYLLAGVVDNEVLDARQELAKLRLAHRAAEEDGFNRRLIGTDWTPPTDEQIRHVYDYLSIGPIAASADDELVAMAKYLDGEPEPLCRGFIKQSRNLVSMNGHDAAHTARILLANVGRVDIARVLSKLCREEKCDAACS